MVAEKQLRLPKLKVQKVRKNRKQSEPSPIRYRSIKKFEILHRPFDLRFRGRINSWLKRLEDKGGATYKTNLNTYQRRIIKLYFYPQKLDKIWLNQLEVIKKTKNQTVKKLKSALVESLEIIWDKEK